MIINTWTFSIGSGIGEYEPGTELTDSMIGLGSVSAISCGNQYFSQGFTVTGTYLSFGDVLTTSAGDKLKIHFENPLTINRND